MQYNFSSKNHTAIALCLVVFVLGLGISIQLNKTPKGLTLESHSAIPFVHAADDSGCSTCHSEPITSGSCEGCHPSPTTEFNNGVIFPHHDEDSDVDYKTCESEECHDAGNDFRYVDTPNASHSYCDGCHEEDIFHGPR